MELVDPVCTERVSVADVWRNPTPTCSPFDGRSVVRAPYAV